MLQNPCPDAQYTVEDRISFYQPPQVDASGKVSAGAWHHVIDEQGCGVRRVLNVLVAARGPGRFDVTPLLPGSTHADPQLQKDAVQYAVRAVATVPGGREAGCTVGYVADTQFVDRAPAASPGNTASSWREVWTLVSCTHKALVPMRFAPDATGTSITAGPNTSIKLVPLTTNQPI
jgi:hypothetical protein